MNDCPSREQLMDFTTGQVDDETAGHIAEHVDTCTDCRTSLQEIDDAADPLVASLAALDRGNPLADDPEFQRAKSFIESIGREPSFKTYEVKQGSGTAVKPLVPDLGEIGQYRLLAKLGEGGMGAVYKALHTKLDKLVALKILPRERTRDPQAVARFEREMKAVGRLEHPNIVRAMDAGEQDGTHYLVMEYVDGVDLSELVRHVGPLSIPDACAIVHRAAQALQYAHASGLIHRDIKPSNIMVEGRGSRVEGRTATVQPSVPQPSSPNSQPSSLNSQPSVKLLDLGLARLQEQAVDDLTSTGQAMGTLDYMAPEQCDDSHGVDARADIYSLGATLYKLLTGEAPFAGSQFNTPAKKLAALLTKPVPPIADRRSEVPEPLAEIIHRLLAKDPEQRPATAGEVAELLAPYTENADLTELVNQLPQETTNMSALTTLVRPAAHNGTDEYLSSSMTETHPGDLKKPVAPSSLLVEQQSDPEFATTADCLPPASAEAPLAEAGGRSPDQPPEPDRRSPQPAARRRILTPPVALALAVGLIGIITLSVIMLFFQTRIGTIVVEIDDPEGSIHVTVAGADILINDKQNEGQPIKLRPGEHKLHVTRGELEFDTDNFTLRRGEKVILSVDVVEGQVQVVRKDQSDAVIGRKTIPKANYALSFDGESSYVEIPWKHDGREALTLEAWTVIQRPLEDQTMEMLMGDAQQGGLGIAYARGKDGSDAPTWTFFYHGGAYRYAREKLPVPRSRVVHLAGVFDGSAEIRFYVDGNLQSRTALAGSLRVTKVPFLLGANPEEAHRGQFFHGLIDEVRISNVARYAKDFTPTERFQPDEHTLALYHFDESQGDIAHDSSGNGFHGKIVGAKWVKANDYEPGSGGQTEVLPRWQPGTAENVLIGIVPRPANLPGIKGWQIETTQQYPFCGLQPRWPVDRLRHPKRSSPAVRRADHAACATIQSDRVDLIDATSLDVRASIEAASVKDVKSIAISPDLKSMVIAGPTEGGSTFEIWDVESGKVKVEGPTVEGIGAVAYSPDGNTFATGEPWITAIRDAETGERIKFLGGKSSAGGPASLRWNESGSVIIAGQNGDCWVWDVQSKKVLRHLDASKYYRAFSVGDRLFVRSSDVNVQRF